MKRSLNSAKSHSGCQHCKTKKVKCDETKPACQVCVKRGLECPGFGPVIRWSRKHERLTDRPPPGLGPTARSKDKRTVKSRLANEVGNPEEALVATSGLEGNQVDDSPGEDALSGLYRPMAVGMDLLEWLNSGSMDTFDNLMLSNLAMLAEPNMNVIPADQTAQSPNSAVQTSGSSQLKPPVEIDLQNQNSLPQIDAALVVSGEMRANHQDGLLGTFYRLSTPTTTARFSEEHLIQLYFDEVCPLYSCFDSDLNPFRSLVADLWTNSMTMCLSMQSMAIAHLANDYQYMAPFGRVKRSQAWKSLQVDLQLYRGGQMPLETILTSLLLLGLSAAWQQPSNLGLEYLFIARNLIQKYLRSKNSALLAGTILTHEKFFLDSLMHWEMLSSFVEPIAMIPFPGFGAPQLALRENTEPIMPHPWTGVTTELHFALAETGRVLRRVHTPTTRRFHTAGKSYTGANDDQWALSLEQLLNKIYIPSPEGIVDYNDENTPKNDLISVAHAHRCMGLLELYNAFPSLLDNKMNGIEVFASGYSRLFIPPPNDASFVDLRHSWLAAIASYIIELISTAAIPSATCRLHPLILVSCASQLRLPDGPMPLTDMQNLRYEEIVEKRSFVESRMLALSRKYPQNQLRQMLDIVNETWSRLDEGQSPAHWLPVAHQQGWQTMMG